MRIPFSSIFSMSFLTELKRSLKLRLMLWLSLFLLLIWTISTAVAWVQVRKDANEMFNGQLVRFAQRLASSDLHFILQAPSIVQDGNQNTQYSPQRHLDHKKKRKQNKQKAFDDDALAFAIFNANGDVLISDGDKGDRFIYQRTKGFSQAQLADDDDLWQIFWLPLGEITIAVGQELDYREDLINGIVFAQMWIWFASLPLLLGLILWILQREFRLFKQVSAELVNRSPEDNHLINMQNIPMEISPLVQSLNGFFDRTASMLQRERRFTSDAAHELRSPLAALRIQTEVAQLLGDDPKMRDDALQNMLKSIDRASQLIEQLLTLSRLDSLEQLENQQLIDWQELAQSLLNECERQAQQKQIELKLVTNGKPTSQGQPLLISLMLRNLIENGIKYCPENSEIELILNEHEIIVQDNGGGVDKSELTKLGQRFYRIAGENEKGSGLGLSIVRRIAELHHHRLNIDNLYNPQGEPLGLKVRILLK